MTEGLSIILDRIISREESGGGEERIDNR